MTENRPALKLLLAAAGGLLFLSYGYTEMAGSDLWWHLAAGRELLQTGSLWLTDSWSFTVVGAAWHNHEWLADIIFYLWSRGFGVSSLVYWKWLTIVLCFGMLQYVLYRQTRCALSAFVCAGMAVAVAAPFLDLRPHLYTLLGFSLLLCLCLERRPARWVLALLFLVWANLHGGFFFGLMALAILLLPWREPSAERVRWALITGLLCAAVCLLNPSGVTAFLQPLVYAFDSSSPYRDLGEWHSPFRAGGIQAPLFFYVMWGPLLGLFYLSPAVRQRLPVPYEALALTLVTLAMALTSRRFIPLYAMSAALLAAPLLSLLLARLSTPGPRYALAGFALLASVLRLAPYPLQSAPAFHYLAAEYSYPEEMLTFMEVNGFKGNVFALYNWGGYLHWRSDGELKVFIDGRANTVFDNATYYQYLEVLHGKPGWVDVIEASGAEFVLWPMGRNNSLAMQEELLATGHWRALYQDSVSWLAAYDTVAMPSRPVAPPESALRHLTRATVFGRQGKAEKSLEEVQQVRAQIPWQKTACQLEISLQRYLRNDAAAQQVLEECLGYFPTRLLR